MSVLGMFTIWILYLFVQGFLLGISCQRNCLTCKDIPLPMHCQSVETCGQHEECFVDTYVSENGQMQYNLGCRDSVMCHQRQGKRASDNNQTLNAMRTTRDKILVCSECCNSTDMCNNAACGKEGWSSRQHGPVCYACSQQLTTTSCSSIKVCGIDAKCIIKQINVMGTDVFATDCFYGGIGQHNCEVGVTTLIGRDTDKSNKIDNFSENVLLKPRNNKFTRSTSSYACCNHTLCNHVLTTNGGWSEWSSWSSCSVTCGNGIQSESRTCTKPSPMDGGAGCVGPNKNPKDCFERQCHVPVNGGWSDWSSSSTCSVPCGNGTYNVRRTCTKPPPSDRGAGCVGPDRSQRDCFDRECQAATRKIIRCLSCDQTVFPHTCNTIDICGPHSSCYVDQHVHQNGVVYYTTGCRDSSQCGPHTAHKRNDGMLICSQCCDSDMCNSVGCGSIGYPHPRGLICYNSVQLPDPLQCTTVEMCQKGQVCMIEEVRNTHNYTLHCGNRSQCASMSVADPVYPKCCLDDLCKFPIATHWTKWSQWGPCMETHAGTIGIMARMRECVDLGNTNTCVGGVTETEEKWCMSNYTNICTPANITDITVLGVWMLGEIVILNCTATGNPVPAIKWQTHTNTGVSQLDEQSIVIGPIENIHRGLFVCEASNMCSNLAASKIYNAIF